MIIDSNCFGCKNGWNRFQNKYGDWMHRNETKTVEIFCDEGLLDRENSEDKNANNI